MFPPNALSIVLPADNIIFPEFPSEEIPGIKEMLPDAPLLEFPVAILTTPLVPTAATPVSNEMAPLTQDPPEFAV